MREYLLCLVAAAAITYFATPIAREIAVKWGAMAEVRDRDVHSMPTPRLGGLAIFAGLVTAIFVASQLTLIGQVFSGGSSEIAALLGAAVVLLVVGMVDDRWTLDPLTKFAGQVLAGGIIASQDQRGLFNVVVQFATATTTQHGLIDFGHEDGVDDGHGASGQWLGCVSAAVDGCASSRIDA